MKKFRTANAKINFIKKITNRTNLSNTDINQLAHKVKSLSIKSIKISEIKQLLKTNAEQKRQQTYNKYVDKLSAKMKIDAYDLQILLRDKNKITKGKKITVDDIQRIKQMIRKPQLVEYRISGALASWLGRTKYKKWGNKSLNQKIKKLLHTFNDYIDIVPVDLLYFSIKRELVDFNKSRKTMKAENIARSKPLQTFFNKKMKARIKKRTE